MMNALPIDSEMIRRYAEWHEGEFGKKLTDDEAQQELTVLKDNGCLLYEDCRSCPLFSKKCPI